MGLTRSDLYTQSQNDIARLAKTIGHPARVAILQHLFAINTCVCGDLVDEIGLSQPTISQHLKELKNAGLIQGRIEGTSVCYCINKEVWKAAYESICTFFNMGSNQCC